MHVAITTITFHDGQNFTSFNFAGSRGYSPPQGRASASVDFQITDSDGSYTTWTEVITGPLPDYNELVKTAYRRLAARLARYGAYGEELRKSFQEDKPAA